MTATLALPNRDALAASFLKKFQPGLLRLARRAGWEPRELPGVAWLAAAGALENFDPTRGDLDARAWALARRQAQKSGFAPAAGIEIGEIELAGDDPAEILAAVEEVGGRLVALGAGVERPARSERTARRYRAAARGAVARLLAGGDGRQGELF